MRQKFDAKFNKGMDGVLNFPDFPFGTSAIGGRVHDDCVIVVSSPDFPFYELDTVVYNPADGSVF